MDTGPSPSFLVPFEHFAQDLNTRLGRANGNVFHRKPGVEAVHDGQIMVRLKKKRFILIDYGIIPTQADLQAAAINPYVATPDGAGTANCVTPHCPKVGVPVLLYDSEPSETASLYLRSGLCFTCQRNLNEKRRTQRKRKSDVPLHRDDALASSSGGSGGGGQKVKHNDQIMDLSSDALVINGPMDGVKKHSEGYSADEIGADLQIMMREAVADTDRLLSGPSMPVSDQQQHQQQASNPETTSAVAYAAAAAAAAASNQLNPSDVTAATISAAVDASSPGLIAQVHNTSSSSEEDEYERLYEKAFTSAAKALYLLTQWKASWDATNAMVHDQAMMPLLMAADKDCKGHEEMHTPSQAKGDDVFSV